MKSLLLLSTCCALSVYAQESTSWTTVTIYSTTTEYQRSTSTTTVSSVPQTTAATSVLLSTSQDEMTTASATPSVELSSSSAIFSSSMVLSDATSTISYVQSSTSLASGKSTLSIDSSTSIVSSASTDSSTNIMSTTISSTPETISSSYSPVSRLSSFITKVVNMPSRSIVSMPSFTPSPALGSTAVPVQSTTLSRPSASSSSSSLIPANVGFNLKVSKSNSSLDGSVLIARNTRFYLGLNASSPAIFSGGDETLNMTLSRLSNRAVFIGRLGGLRYTRLSVNYSLPNGTVTTGWEKQAAADGDSGLSNESGLFHACPRVMMGPGVYQVYVDIAGFASKNCTAFAAVMIAISGI